MVLCIFQNTFTYIFSNLVNLIVTITSACFVVRQKTESFIDWLYVVQSAHNRFGLKSWVMLLPPDTWIRTACGSS